MEYLASGPWLIIGRETSWAIRTQEGGLNTISSFQRGTEDPSIFVVDQVDIGRSSTNRPESKEKILEADEEIDLYYT